MTEPAQTLFDAFVQFGLLVLIGFSGWLCLRTIGRGNRIPYIYWPWLALLALQSVSFVSLVRTTGDNSLVSAPLLYKVISHADDLRLAPALAVLALLPLRSAAPAGLANTKVAAVWVLLFAAAILSGLVNRSAGPAVAEGLQQMAVTVVSIAAFLFGATRLPFPLVRKTIQTLLGSLVVLSLVAYLQAPNWALTDEWPGGFAEGPRLAGYSPQPNSLGFFAAILIVSLCAIPKLSRIYYPLIAAAIWTICLTGSRGAVAATIFGLVALLAYRYARTAWAAMVCIGFVMAAATPFLLGTEFLGLDTARTDTWAYSLSIWRDNMMFGAGPAQQQYGYLETTLYSHNQMLQSLTEGGLVGGVLLVVATAMSVRKVWRSGGAIGAGVIGSLVAVFAFENYLRVSSSLFELAVAVPLVLIMAGDQIEQPDDGVPSAYEIESHRKDEIGLVEAGVRV